MNKYEAMFIIKPDLSEEERKGILNQIAEAITKHSGQIISAEIWSEKRKFCFSIKKQQDGVYYLVNFSLDPAAVQELKQIYGINENILRVLITCPQ